MILETERLLLRRWSVGDIDDFHELISGLSCADGGWRPSESRENSLDILRAYTEDDGVFAVVLKESGRAVGFVKILRDDNRGKYRAKMINYCLNENYRNNGYMTEAVGRIVRYAFDDLRVDLLSAFTASYNVASRSVLEKCGFIYEGTIENGYKRYDGTVFDSIIYSIFGSSSGKNGLKSGVCLGSEADDEAGT